MSRWVTYYHDVMQDKVSALEVHKNKEDALKCFNKTCHYFFEMNTDFKANKLPASYGYPFRKYIGCSVTSFKKEFGISVDEAMKISEE